jgi:hypothetical protein
MIMIFTTIGPSNPTEVFLLPPDTVAGCTHAFYHWYVEAMVEVI